MVNDSALAEYLFSRIVWLLGLMPGFFWKQRLFRFAEALRLAMISPRAILVTDYTTFLETKMLYCLKQVSWSYKHLAV